MWSQRAELVVRGIRVGMRSVELCRADAKHVAALWSVTAQAFGSAGKIMRALLSIDQIGACRAFRQECSIVSVPHVAVAVPRLALGALYHKTRFDELASQIKAFHQHAACGKVQFPLGEKPICSVPGSAIKRPFALRLTKKVR